MEKPLTFLENDVGDDQRKLLLFAFKNEDIQSYLQNKWHKQYNGRQDTSLWTQFVISKAKKEMKWPTKEVRVKHI